MGYVIMNAGSDGFKEELANKNVLVNLASATSDSFGLENDLIKLGVSGLLPIINGGTGASDKATAVNNLIFLGMNVITSTTDDTTAKWKSLGTGYGYFNTTGCLIGQPSQYGILINIAHTSGSDLIQLFKNQSASGRLYVRSGNSSGWHHGFVSLIDYRGGEIGDALTFVNTDNYFAISKTRNVSSVPHKLTIGSAASGASTLEHYTNGTLDGRIELSAAGLTMANGTGAVGTKLMRNIYAGTGSMTAKSTALTTGCIYMQYS